MARAASHRADTAVLRKAKAQLPNPRIEAKEADELVRQSKRWMSPIAATCPVATITLTPVMVISRSTAGLSRPIAPLRCRAKSNPPPAIELADMTLDRRRHLVGGQRLAGETLATATVEQIGMRGSGQSRARAGLRGPRF